MTTSVSVSVAQRDSGLRRNGDGEREMRSARRELNSYSVTLLRDALVTERWLLPSSRLCFEP
jgi:hypothetical protein